MIYTYTGFTHHIYGYWHLNAQHWFEPTMLKLVVKMYFLSISKILAHLIINIMIFSNFENEWCTFDTKKKPLRKKKIITSKFCVLSLLETFIPLIIIQSFNFECPK